MTENKSKYYGMLIGSMLIYGTIGIFRKYIPLSSGVLAFSRGILGSLTLYLYLRATKRRLQAGIPRKTLMLLALTGAMIGINWMLLFEAFNYTSVPTATLSYYMAPTLIILASPIMFKEKLTLKKWGCVILALFGMFCISGVFDATTPGNVSIKGVLLGLAAACLYASVIIINKSIYMDDAYTKTIIQLFSASLIMIPYLLLTEDFSGITFTGFSVVMLLIVGLIHTGLAYAFYFGSIQHLSSQSAAILSYIDPVSALILSALILHESLSLIGLVGAILIIGSALVSELTA